jgi:hypothetical protein
MDLTTLLLFIITIACHQWKNDLFISLCGNVRSNLEHVTQKSTTKINKYGEKETPCPTNVKNKDET